MISLSLLLSSHLRIFQHPRVRSFIWCYPDFNLLKSRSPPLRVYCPQLFVALFALGFPSPPVHKTLGSPRTITRRLIMQKAGRHPAHSKPSESLLPSESTGCFQSSPSSWIQNGLGSDTLYAIGFRYYFTPLAGVLFTFPSRYLFTIGCQGVFSLIQWSGRIHAEFHVHRITWDTPRRLWTSLTRLSRSLVDFSKPLSSSATCHIGVPQPRRDKSPRFRLFRFRSPLLTESLRFLFLRLLRCFTSPRVASPDYAFVRR